MNIDKPYKIPTTFDQLSKYILKNNNIDELIFSKTWYCSNCIKIVKLKNPNQRSCSVCNYRYVTQLTVQIKLIFN